MSGSWNYGPEELHSRWGGTRTCLREWVSYLTPCRCSEKVSCHNGKFKPHLPPSFGCVWWDTLPWYFKSWRLASMLKSQAKFPLLCILCLLLPTGTDDGCPWPHEGGGCVTLVRLVELGGSSHTQMGLKATDLMNLLFFLLQMRSQDIWW